MPNLAPLAGVGLVRAGVCQPAAVHLTVEGPPLAGAVIHASLGTAARNSGILYFSKNNCNENAKKSLREERKFCFDLFLEHLTNE